MYVCAVLLRVCVCVCDVLLPVSVCVCVCAVLLRVSVYRQVEIFKRHYKARAE